MFFVCVFHTVNILICFKFFFYTKNIGSFENMFLYEFFKHDKKLFSCIFGFYIMFIKLQRILVNILKNKKFYFGENSSTIHR